MGRPIGRFAPTPSGRMHLGNLFAAMLAWASVRSRGGTMVLRMEDLDTQRTKTQYADQLRRDLEWLGLDWDLETPAQSTRSEVYRQNFHRLADLGLVYPCYCSRARLHDPNAPHAADGVYIYDGRCLRLTEAERAVQTKAPAWRLRVPDREYGLTDRVQGVFRQNLATDCGDFLIRRADGVYMYQLAVVVDDGEAGVTEVVRGADLLPSAPRQMYLQDLLSLPHPDYYHVPMLLAPDGRRLSKRDGDLDVGALRQFHRPEDILGTLAHAAGQLETPGPISAQELASIFVWKNVPKEAVCLEAKDL